MANIERPDLTDAVARGPYNAPRLVAYGPMADFTAGGSGNINETTSNCMGTRLDRNVPPQCV